MRHGRGKDVGPLCYGNNFGCFQFLVFSFLDFFTFSDGRHESIRPAVTFFFFFEVQRMQQNE
jgi:hypothetical protein